MVEHVRNGGEVATGAFLLPNPAGTCGYASSHLPSHYSPYLLPQNTSYTRHVYTATLSPHCCFCMIPLYVVTRYFMPSSSITSEKWRSKSQTAKKVDKITLRRLKWNWYCTFGAAVYFPITKVVVESHLDRTYAHCLLTRPPLLEHLKECWAVVIALAILWWYSGYLQDLSLSVLTNQAHPFLSRNALLHWGSTHHRSFHVLLFLLPAKARPVFQIRPKGHAAFCFDRYDFCKQPYKRII